MQAINKKPLVGKWAEITDTHLGMKNALWEFSPGKCVLPELFENYAQQILDAPVRKDDIWLISYPRTGSTWCQEVIWLLGNNLNFDGAKSTIQQLRAPLIEMSVALFEYADQFKNIFTNSVNYVNELPSPRFIKSHLPMQFLPRELNTVKPKIIYVIRDPKDTCVSFYYHCKLLHGFNVEFETFCDLFLNGAVIYGDLLDHYLEFWKKRHEENILIIKYEDMKQHTIEFIKKIAKFIEKDITEEEVEALNNYVQFPKMKENKSCNCELLLDKKGGKKYFEEAGYHFIRKGEIGDWKNHMSLEIIKKFDDWFERKTKGTYLLDKEVFTITSKTQNLKNYEMVRTKSDQELDNILKTDFTSIFRPGYVESLGITMPRRFDEMKENIFNWSVNERDVWICSYPKTGTTWTQEMVWMIMNNLDFIKGQENLGIRSPFLEVSALFDYRKFKEEHSEFRPPPFIDDSLKFVRDASSKGPLCLKTHLPWILLPKAIQNNSKKPKIIYVTRNPQDTCISYYNHSRLMEGFRGNFEDFCKLFLAGKVTFGPYWKHVFSFWERKNQPNILFLKYEQMIEDLPSVIKKVADFLEKPLTTDQINTLNNHLSFENMKNNPAVNYEMVVNLNRKFKIIEYDGTFMRSGKVGDYKAKMSPEVKNKFEEWIEENTNDKDTYNKLN